MKARGRRGERSPKQPCLRRIPVVELQSEASAGIRGTSCARHADKLSDKPPARCPSILTNVRIHAPFIMEFEWDPAKEAKNLEKHGISARRARTHEEAEYRKQVERAAAEGGRG